MSMTVRSYRTTDNVRSQESPEAASHEDGHETLELSNQISEHPLTAIAIAAAAGACLGILMQGRSRSQDDREDDRPERRSDVRSEPRRRQFARRIQQNLPAKARLRRLTNELIASVDDPRARDQLYAKICRVPDDLKKMLDR